MTIKMPKLKWNHRKWNQKHQNFIENFPKCRNSVEIIEKLEKFIQIASQNPQNDHKNLEIQVELSKINPKSSKFLWKFHKNVEIIEKLEKSTEIASQNPQNDHKNVAIQVESSKMNPKS